MKLCMWIVLKLFPEFPKCNSLFKVKIKPLMKAVILFWRISVVAGVV